MTTKVYNNIDYIILDIITKCSNDPKLYSNIMSEYFKKGIEKKNVWLESLNILPPLKEKDLMANFRKNINKINNFIKSEIKPGLDIYYVLSCIFGAFLGDATGAFCEFGEPNQKNRRNIFATANTVIGGVKGQITDDSEMALDLSYGIMDMPSKYELDPDYIYFYYGSWYKSNPLDIGSTTTKALKHFDFEKFHPKFKNFASIEEDIRKKNMKSLSNGFLMRKSPFIAWFYYRFYGEINSTLDPKNNSNAALIVLYSKIKDISANDNKITNPNSETNVVMGLYGLIAIMAIKGFKAKEIFNTINILCSDSYFLNSNNNDEKQVASDIIGYINFYKEPNFDLWKAFGDKKSPYAVFTNMGFYFHALKLILYYLYNFDKIEPNHPEKKYREIMNQICDLGGDTDTNCCIVGAIIGPLIGMSNFGIEFTKMIEVIPPGRAIFSASLAVLLVIYLRKSSISDEYIYNDKYFLQQLLTMLYGDIQLDYN